MRSVCAWCKKDKSDGPYDPDQPISHGICTPCSAVLMSQMGFLNNPILDAFPAPVVVVNAAGRITSGNQTAQTMTGKSAQQMAGLPGGNVFECEYSYLPDGCGNTKHCSRCLVRGTVMASMADTHGRTETAAVLNQRTPDGVRVLELKISTEKLADHVLLRVDSVQPVLTGGGGE